jgi:hypothetical protein
MECLLGSYAASSGRGSEIGRLEKVSVHDEWRGRCRYRCQCTLDERSCLLQRAAWPSVAWRLRAEPKPPPLLLVSPNRCRAVAIAARAMRDCVWR